MIETGSIVKFRDHMARGFIPWRDAQLGIINGGDHTKITPETRFTVIRMVYDGQAYEQMWECKAHGCDFHAMLFGAEIELALTG